MRTLEIGLGTGLNALLTLEAARAVGAAIEYDGLETFPLPPVVVAALQPEWDARGHAPARVVCRAARRALARAR